jgi:peroxiredoxin
MIDFEVKDLQGKPFKLSSLLGKDILLSFWSKGCGPCRMENKKISDNYEKYKDKIAIVSFSIDNNKKYWIDASKEDNIRWTNVSDLEGEIGIIKTKYSVQAIPTSFLINKDGIIIEKFTGFGEKFLSSIENIIK